jgi:hypothetical protein
MPRVKMPAFGRSRKEAATTEVTPGDGESAAADAKTVEAGTAEKATAETRTAETKPAETKPGETKSAEKPAAPAEAPKTPPTMNEKIEGLQGWMAEIERKQARMTYFGAVGLLIAIAAAGAALYFGITAKNDSATKGDLDQLSSKVGGLEQAVTKNNQNTQQAINNSIAQLQISISDLQRKQAQDAANIATLQSQAQQGAFNKAAPGTAGANAKTNTNTTTTPSK